jgi:hypothetical protein
MRAAAEHADPAVTDAFFKNARPGRKADTSDDE